jgi:hypothetical protein
MCRVRRSNLPNHQKIKKHPHRCELLLNGRLGSGKILNPSGHMERSHSREFQAMSGAPVKKLPASTRVSLSGIPVANRSSEKVNVAFSNFGAGSGDQLRKSTP